MRKLVILSTVLGLATMAPLTAQAADDDSGIYVNLGLTLLDTDIDTDDADLAGIDAPSFLLGTGRVGYQLNEYLAVEGELGIGLGSEDLDLSDLVTIGGSAASGDIKVKNYYGGFVRGIYPVSDNFDVFARIGYGQAEVEANVEINLPTGLERASVSDTGDDVMFGGGAQYNFSEKSGIRADYTRFSDTNLFSVTFAQRF